MLQINQLKSRSFYIIRTYALKPYLVQWCDVENHFYNDETDTEISYSIVKAIQEVTI